MKIRNGFVSNSSSTSFCICGIYWEDGDFDKEFQEKLLNSKFEKYSNQGDYYYLGISIDEMKNDETKAQFISRVEEMFKEEISDIDLEKHKVHITYDGWYEG